MQTVAVPIREYPLIHTDAAVAEVQVNPPVPQAVQAPLAKKYPLPQVVAKVELVHAVAPNEQPTQAPPEIKNPDEQVKA